jgi:hypothetical protein
MSIRGVDQATIRDAIDARLTDDETWIDKGQRRRVHHLTYGQHTATNAYKHVRRVILMGLNFLPRPAGHAAAGAALDLDLVTEHPTETQIEDLQSAASPLCHRTGGWLGNWKTEEFRRFATPWII